MGRKKAPEILHCPVHFGGVSIGDNTARVSISIDREKITLQEADDLLCEKRLTGRLVVLPGDIDPDQQSLPGMDEKHELTGVFDTRGFSARKKKIGTGATFTLDTIDIEQLGHFAERDGRLIVDLAEEIPEPEKDDDGELPPAPKSEGPWKKTAIDKIGLRALDSQKLAEADILTAGDLQNRINENGIWWGRNIKGIGDAAKERIENAFNAFVIENADE